MLRLLCLVLALVGGMAGAPSSPPAPQPARHSSRYAEHASERYVRICSQYGDLTNQIVIIIKAYAIAHVLNRTLVLPPIKGLDFFQVFDEAALRAGPVRVVPTAQYHAIPTQEGCLFTTSSRHCPCRRAVTEGQRSATRTLLVHAKAVFGDTMDLRLFDPQGQPRFGMDFRRPACMNRHLQPAHRIEHDITHFAKTRLPRDYLAVHLRADKYSTYPKCSGAIFRLAKELWSAYNGTTTWKPTGWECVMTPEYVQQFRNQSQHRFFLGTDDKNHTRTLELEAMGAVRFSAPRLNHSAQVGVADQFLMARGAVFLGNPFSSFSAFICDLRRVRGLRCPTMPPELKPCLSYPDYLVTPHKILHDRRIRRGPAGMANTGLPR